MKTVEVFDVAFLAARSHLFSGSAVPQGLLLSLIIQLTGATLFGFIIAATRRIVQFIAPIQKVTITNLQVTKRSGRSLSWIFLAACPCTK